MKLNRFPFTSIAKGLSSLLQTANNKLHGSTPELEIEKLTIEKQPDDTFSMQVRTIPAEQSEIAMLAGKFFRESRGAVNYISFRFFDPIVFKSYEVIIQRIDKPSYGEVNVFLRMALQQIRDGKDNPQEIAARMLKRLGYEGTDV